MPVPKMLRDLRHGLLQRGGNPHMHPSQRLRQPTAIFYAPPPLVLQGTGGTYMYADESRGSLSGGSDDSRSATHSSDYDDDAERPDSASLLDRFRGLRKDMQKKISKVKSPRGSGFGGASPEGEMGGRGGEGDGGGAAPSQSQLYDTTSAQHPDDPARVRLATVGVKSPVSPPPPAPYTGPFIGRAVALADFQPSPYEVTQLKFKKGDVIDIISKSPSGIWKGCVDGRVGHFKFILVDEDSARSRPQRRSRPPGAPPPHHHHASLETLLKTMHLGHLLQVFMLNGYENLEQFRELEEQDLDSLGIKDPETRSRLLAAVASILDYETSSLSIVGQVHEGNVVNNTSSSSRDSGCFTDQRVATLAPDADENNLDARQSSPSTDNSSGYQSRGNYNIPIAGEVSSTLQEVPDTTLDSSSSTEDAPITRNKKYPTDMLKSQQAESCSKRPSDSTKQNTAHAHMAASQEPDSYRATRVTVRPGTPDGPGTEAEAELRDRPDKCGQDTLLTGSVESPRSSNDTGVSVKSGDSSIPEEPPGSGEG